MLVCLKYTMPRMSTLERAISLFRHVVHPEPPCHVREVGPLPAARRGVLFWESGVEDSKGTRLREVLEDIAVHRSTREVDDVVPVGAVRVLPKDHEGGG